MDRQSHGNGKLSLGPTGQGGGDRMNLSDSAGSGNFHLKEVADLRRPFSPVTHSYLVSRAYREPVGTDHVEQFILQRCYIID